MKFSIRFTVYTIYPIELKFCRTTLDVTSHYRAKPYFSISPRGAVGACLLVSSSRSTAYSSHSIGLNLDDTRHESPESLAAECSDFLQWALWGVSFNTDVQDCPSSSFTQFPNLCAVLRQYFFAISAIIATMQSLKQLQTLQLSQTVLTF